MKSITKNSSQVKKTSSLARFWGKPIPETERFAFKLYNFQFDGLVFILANLLVPFASLFIIRYTLGFDTDKVTGTLVYLAICLVSYLFSGIYFFKKDPQLFVKSGLFIFYVYQILYPIAVLILSAIGNSLFGKDSPWETVWNLGIQLILEGVIIWWAFHSTIDLKERIRSTFQKQGGRLLLMTILGIAVITAVTMLYSYAVQNTPLGSESDNQDSLLKGLKGDNQGVKIATAFVLALFTIVVAPMVEELTTRQSWFVGTGNKYIAWITSALFFAMIHVNSGDVEHILNYFIAGLVLSSIFLFSKGNITYSWLVHAGYNTITFIIILATL